MKYIVDTQLPFWNNVHDGTEHYAVMYVLAKTDVGIYVAYAGIVRVDKGMHDTKKRIDLAKQVIRKGNTLKLSLARQFFPEYHLHDTTYNMKGV